MDSLKKYSWAGTRNSGGDQSDDGYEGEYIKTIAKEILDQHGDGLSPDDKIFRNYAEELIFADIKKTLKTIGINHDVFSNEQTYYTTGAIDVLVEDLRNKDLISRKPVEDCLVASKVSASLKWGQKALEKKTNLS